MNHVLRKVLNHLQENPALCRAVALELQRLQEAGLQDHEKALSAALVPLVEKFAGLEASLEKIRVADHQRVRLHYLNTAVHRNGKLSWHTPGEEI